MIFGADVSHETSTSESIAAVSQQPRQRSSFEIISTYLSLSLVERLSEAWTKNAFPMQLDSMLKAVREERHTK